MHSQGRLKQERLKIRHDYFQNPTGQYSLDDPWTRSRIWRRHTGHWGKFYNCDGEEQKRYSPYICWKNADCPFVDESWRYLLWRDKQEIRRRISDGSCSTCQEQHTPTQRSCNCHKCTTQVAQAQTRQRQPSQELEVQPSLLSRLESQDSDFVDVTRANQQPSNKAARQATSNGSQNSTRRSANASTNLLGWLQSQRR